MSNDVTPRRRNVNAPSHVFRQLLTEIYFPLETVTIRPALCIRVFNFRYAMLYDRVPTTLRHDDMSREKSVPLSTETEKGAMIRKKSAPILKNVGESVISSPRASCFFQASFGRFAELASTEFFSRHTLDLAIPRSGCLARISFHICLFLESLAFFEKLAATICPFKEYTIHLVKSDLREPCRIIFKSRVLVCKLLLLLARDYLNCLLALMCLIIFFRI